MGSRTFPDRAAAGRELGAALARRQLAEPVVLGLARGGLVVAAQVASALGVPVEVLVVRKIGHPLQPELAVGAVVEGGEPVLDEQARTAYGVDPEALAGIVAAEEQECRRRVAVYRGGRPAPQVAGRTAVLVDDGVATGLTALAAVRAMRGRAARRVVLAAPVMSREAHGLLTGEADDLVTLEVPRRFGAVSRFYADFPQTRDAEVLALLGRG